MIVVVSFAEPIWASGHRAASKAEHMTAIAPLVRLYSLPLASKGSSPHAIQLLSLTSQPAGDYFMVADHLAYHESEELFREVLV